MNTELLCNMLDVQLGKQNIEGKNIPGHIRGNLNHKFQLRPYQENALKYLLTYLDDYNGKTTQQMNHLFFHMATGSGKTLIMASVLLEMYKRGHRRFVFYVHNNTILEKTISNFTNAKSSKYLFDDNISIDGTPIEINVLKSFARAKPNAINIMFTSIQQLRSQVINPRENGFSLSEFSKEKTVFLADEGHHYQADTKSKSIREEVTSWEEIIDKLYSSNVGNFKFEFSATLDLSNKSLFDKYSNKIIFDYQLKYFRIDKYSKEVEVLETKSQDLLLRSLIAILISQYRKLLFMKNNVYSKPVVMFKSKLVKESANFQKELHSYIQSLDVEFLEGLLSSGDNDLLLSLYQYLNKEDFKLKDFLDELKLDFNNDKHLVIDSKNKLEANILSVNSLEDRDNPYRCIFAVDMLNEGWDVLNLFDIVRLYNTRDPTGNTQKGSKKVGRTTTREAQLIGRGARYFPFQINSEQIVDKRKYDSDLENEMRICETLIYHSTSNPKYIHELRTALVENGVLPEKSHVGEVSIKPEIKKLPFFNSGHIYLNKKIKLSESSGLNFKNIFSTTILNATSDSFATIKSSIFDGLNDERFDNKTETINLTHIEIPMLENVLEYFPGLYFNKLLQMFPNLNSTIEFITSGDYLGGLTFDHSYIDVDFQGITNREKIAVLKQVIGQIETLLSSEKSEYVGSKQFIPEKLTKIFHDKILNFSIDASSKAEFGKSILRSYDTEHFLDISKREWFCHTDFFGTSEEKLLVHYFEKNIEYFQKRFDQILLFRNEKFFKLNNFENGAVFEPDFVLFLVNETPNGRETLQIFIEPKGEHLLIRDSWKEKFLLEIEHDAELMMLIDEMNVRVLGLPFYNLKREKEFDIYLKQKLMERD